MVVLRSLSHREQQPTPKSVETRRCAERHKRKEKRLLGPRKSSRSSSARGTTTDRKAPVVSTKPSPDSDRAATTPLAEKQNENARVAVDITSTLALRSKMGAEASSSQSPSPRPTRVSSADANHSYSRRQNKICVKRMKTKARTTKKRRLSRDSDGSWMENISPPPQSPLLEDEMPLMITCWQ